jgi:hypothetical protein
MADSQSPLYHVQLRQKNGAYLGLHFVNGVSREVVEGPKDPMLRKIRAIFGSASFTLIPANQGAVAPPPPLPNPDARIPDWGTAKPSHAAPAPVPAPLPPPAPPQPAPAPPAAVEKPAEGAPKAKPWAERMKEAKAAKAKGSESK